MGFNETSDCRNVSKSLRIPKDIYEAREARWKGLKLSFTQYVLLLMEYDERYQIIEPQYFKDPEKVAEKNKLFGNFRLTG